MGDDLQWEKAGVLEVADIVFIHKADLPGAEQVAAQVKTILGLAGDSVPVLRGSARTGAGLEELWSAILACPAPRPAEPRGRRELLRLAHDALTARFAAAATDPAFATLLARWQEGGAGTRASGPRCPARPGDKECVMSAAWDPWHCIPERYNLGVALTRGQVEQGRGAKPALLWENAAGQSCPYTYAVLDEHSTRLASSLRAPGSAAGRPGLSASAQSARVLCRRPGRRQARRGFHSFKHCSSATPRCAIGSRIPGRCAVITTASLIDVVERVRTDCPALRHRIAVLEPKTSVSSDVHDYDRPHSRGRPGVSSRRHAQRRPCLSRLHLGHDRRSQGRGPPSAVSPRVRVAGPLLA